MSEKMGNSPSLSLKINIFSFEYENFVPAIIISLTRTLAKKVLGIIVDSLLQNVYFIFSFVARHTFQFKPNTYCPKVVWWFEYLELKFNYDKNNDLM